MRKQGSYISDRRLKFKKGLQRKFIFIIKEKTRRTWKEIADNINVCEHTVRIEWYNEKTTLPYKKTRKLLRLYPFVDWETILNKWVDKVLPKAWGQRLGGGKNKKKIKYPERCEKLAEFLGIVLGDGHLDKRVFTLSSDIIEKEYVLYVRNLINNLFGLNSKIFVNPCNKNNLFLRVYSTELVKFLLKNSMKIGNKIKNKSCFPRWIFKNKKFVISAIRGLFDTDGGVYGKQEGYRRAIIEFQTKSQYINQDTKKLLGLLKFSISKSNNKKTGKMDTRIQNQKELHIFFKLVGSNNLKNILRYKKFVMTGKIPSYKNTIRLIKKYRLKSSKNLQFEFVGRT